MSVKKSVEKSQKKFAPIGINWQDAGKALGIGSQLGFTISIPLLIGVLAGVYLDKWAKSSPLFVLLGIGFGIIGGIYGTIKILKQSFWEI